MNVQGVSAMMSNMQGMETAMKISTSVTSKALDTTKLIGNMVMENIESAKVDPMVKDPNRGHNLDILV
ncbi:hypothetical protein OF820_01495 [Oceanotoga sp. DSM 15011]|jgi:hypothetical protein|uniref:Uncharacterized protein n=1 Tax=Oceanotoga teriensis TaxID=515440 RepID=A0AA45C947_9BACT|nr:MULTISPECIES: putative motility protein [Oceanotoga]MDN5342723.1 hypothetical protein [Oceanotoga sp.]MDO7977608.1 hypothetical protein [Oceanotoga teriensis]PWJ96457.1 hypothetical protein C7380_10129 [Oceanotoga teriensis]UYP00369.1 hypothetical protein OF820_01495 [Oceanotoga sp. DSM 15011]